MTDEQLNLTLNVNFGERGLQIEDTCHRWKEFHFEIAFSGTQATKITPSVLVKEAFKLAV